MLYGRRTISLRRGRGFTLVELMTVSFILAMIMGAIMATFTIGNRSMALADQRVDSTDRSPDHSRPAGALLARAPFPIRLIRDPVGARRHPGWRPASGNGGHSRDMGATE